MIGLLRGSFWNWNWKMFDFGEFCVESFLVPRGTFFNLK